MTVLDATLGKGSDALFMLKLLSNTGRLYAFDIQMDAIHLSKNKILQENYSNVEFICDSHIHVKKHITSVLDFAVFNLGYLPSFNKAITTTATQTKIALSETFDLLAIGGLMMVTVYAGHENGYEEKEMLSKLVPHVDQKTSDILMYEFSNQINHPPFTYIFEKKREGNLWNEDIINQ
jgi:hypothetical protein